MLLFDTGSRLTAITTCCLLAFSAQLLGQDTGIRDASNRQRSVAAFDGSGWSGQSWLSGPQTQMKLWSTGIEGENTDVGVVIRAVQRNSAAERAQLRPGDTIISVGGFQVGNVEGQIYALDDEVNRRATTNGIVSLLVQESRSGRLASFRIQLDGRNDTLRGQIILRDARALPADAVVTLDIDNLSRSHYRPHIQNNTFAASAIVNRNFELPYDRSFIDPQDVYEVRATVTSQGRTLYVSSQPQRVLTRGNPSEVRLELIPLDRYVASYPANTGGGTAVTPAGYQDTYDLDTRIKRVYTDLLGRSPTAIELVAWRYAPEKLETMPLEIMASQEFFDRTGNNSRVWVEEVFRQIVGKQPNATELNDWLLHLARLRNSRTQMLNHLQSAVNQQRR